jgi:hypothetical protein
MSGALRTQRPADPVDAKRNGVVMAEVERIWRITIDGQSRIEIRLFTGPDGEQQVVLDQLGAGSAGGVFGVDVARAIAQVMLEACEVSSALSEQLAMA